MFPPFRVRGIKIADGEDSQTGPRLEDGYVRITSQDYDDLMKRKPKAALKYIDSDDGEMILVGSAFELGQRLHDPLDPSELQKHAKTPSKRLSPPPMHVFDVERETDVLEEWQKLDRQTQWAAVLHGLKTPQEEHKLKRASLEQMHPARPSFGRPSPLSINSWARRVERPQTDNTHTKRWASYGRVLPGRLDQKASELPASEPVPKPNSVPSNMIPQPKELPSDTANKKASDDHTPSSSKGKQKTKPDGAQTHQPLLEMFEKELAKILPSTRNMSDSITPCIEKATTVIDDDVTKSDSNPPEPAPTSNFASPPPPSGLNELYKVLQEAGVDIEAGARDAEEALKKIFEARTSIVNSVRSMFPYLTTPKSNVQMAGPTPQTSNATTQISTRTDAAVNTERPKSVSSEQKTSRWEVERIIGRRYICYGSYKNGPRIRQYLVRWVGHTEESDVWYDAENLADCENLVLKYEMENPEESLVDLDSSFIPSLHEALKLHDRTARSIMVTWAERNASCGPPIAAKNISDANLERKDDLQQTRSPATKAHSGDKDTVTGSSRQSDTHSLHRSEPPTGAGSSVPDSHDSPLLGDDLPAPIPILRGRRRSLPMLRRNAEGARPKDLESAGSQHIEHKASARMEDLQQAKAQQSQQPVHMDGNFHELGKFEPWPPSAVKYDRTLHIQKDTKENKQKLKHRQSWHPISNTAEKDTKETNAFSFDPFAVMWKYPTVPQFERSHFAANPPSLPKQTPNVMDAPPVQRAEISEAQVGPGLPADTGLQPSVPKKSAGLNERNKSKSDEAPVRHPSFLELQQLERRQSMPRKMPSTPILKPTIHPQRSATVHGRPQHPPARVSFSDVTSVIQPRDNSGSSDFTYSAEDEDAVKKCHRALLEMGFKVSQALEIARAADGNLETAIDIADEDQKARSGSTYMPGAWNGSFF